MEKLFSYCLALISGSIVAFLIITATCGCTSTNSVKENNCFDSIKKYFVERHNYNIESGIKKIFVITENGCVPCNKKLAELCSYSIHNNSCIMLITSTGTQVDISNFNPAEKNIFFDQNVTETPYEIFYTSKVIFIKNKAIDTIITLDAHQLEKQFEIIKTRN
ncbi:hypothetical protein BH10BAC1_BH10BAC1_08660 [soil metagenome]